MKEIPVMQFGRFKGKELDVRTRRSAQLLLQDNENTIVKYFFHNSKFHIAKIPTKSIKSVMGQRFSFGLANETSPSNSFFTNLKKNLVNHAQVRFVFNKSNPVKLYHLDDEECKKEELGTINDIVYSVEVIGPKGEKWSLKNAFGNLVCAHRVLSTEEMFFERVLLCNYVIDQTPDLKFTDEEKMEALNLCLKNASKAGMNTPYYLITPFFGASNCTSEAFDILDRTMWPRYKFTQKLIAKSLWRLPISLERYLKLRGIDLAEHTGMTFNDEFKQLYERKDLQERLNEINKRKEN